MLDPYRTATQTSSRLSHVLSRLLSIYVPGMRRERGREREGERERGGERERQRESQTRLVHPYCQYAHLPLIRTYPSHPTRRPTNRSILPHFTPNTHHTSPFAVRRRTRCPPSRNDDQLAQRSFAFVCVHGVSPSQHRARSERDEDAAGASAALCSKCFSVGRSAVNGSPLALPTLALFEIWSAAASR